MSQKGQTPRNKGERKGPPHETSSSGKTSRPLQAAASEVSLGQTRPERTENRKILVVGREAGFSEPVMDYAVNLAERLGYDLIAMNVSPGPEAPGLFFSPYQKYLQEKFKRQALAQADLLRQKVTPKGVRFEHLVKFGDLGKTLENLNQERKRIEFVINASEPNEPEVSAGVTLPVFTIKGYEGESTMTQYGEKSYRPIGKTVALGLGAMALYAAVFLNGGTIMEYFTRGGWYAALPIATVFAFSFVHGAFANYLWIALGVEAPKKSVRPRPAAAKRPVRRPRPRPRLTLNV